MAGRKRSWTVRLPARAKTWTVRVWLPEEHRTVELSTGESDPDRAESRGAQLAAELLAGSKAPPAPRRSTCDGLSTAVVAVDWLAACKGRLGELTVGAYALAVKSHLGKAFPSLLDVGYDSVKGYIDQRLKEVQPPTVRHELSVLRLLCEWAVEQHKLSRPPQIPGMPKRASGTAYSKPRRAKPDENSPDEIRAFLDALPERSALGYWVRPRFELQYETGLRSSTLDKLEVPKHWRPGARELRLEKMVLKNRRAYTLPLTDRAVAILKRVAPKTGIVFGKHDLREFTEAAAEAALPEGKADRFAPIHLRSAFITHLLDQGAPLTVAQGAAGHARPSTTDRYSRTSERKVAEGLRKLGRRA